MLKICKLIRKHSFQDARVFQKQARSLAAMGHEVVVMAPVFNGYVLDINRKPVKKAGASPFQIENVTFQPYQAKRPANEQQAALAEKNRLYEIQNDRNVFHYDQLFNQALAVEADVYHAHERETLYEAVQIKRMLRNQGKSVKVIFDAHELEADTPLLRLLMAEVDHMITVSESIRSIYLKRYPQTPVHVVYNSPKSSGVIAAGSDNYAHRAAYSEEAPFTIAYEGMLTRQKGDPYRIMRIIDRMSEQGMYAKFKILGYIRLIGATEQAKLERGLKEHQRIDFSWVDYDELEKHWKGVNVGYIYFDLKEANRLFSLPNKFFSLMNNGIPIVVNGAAAMGQVIKEHQCGVVIDKPDASAEDYVEQLTALYHDRELLERLSRNARAAMQDVFGWERMEKRLADLYASL